ncbi:MAG TPA: biopolymer transporter ExbD [Tepidisphaeraceae bacterium]|nr:biopolymer transporter ExbD [Tepidisphaeraceae bacterium]
MRIRDVQGESEEPFNLVPLMDMAFNLLIFFMAATSFTQIEKDMNVQLPRTAPFQTMSAPPKQLVINIRQDGSSVVAGKTYTNDELARLIQTEIKPDPNRAVLIRADERSLMKYFAGVATLCRRAGVSELKIGLLQQDASAK